MKQMSPVLLRLKQPTVDLMERALRLAFRQLNGEGLKKIALTLKCSLVDPRVVLLC
jgi:hypothetical protein